MSQPRVSFNLPRVPGDDGVTRPTKNGWSHKDPEPTWWAVYRARLWPNREDPVQHLAERGFAETKDSRTFDGPDSSFAHLVPASKGRWHLSIYGGTALAEMALAAAPAVELPAPPPPTDKAGQMSFF